MSAARRVSPLLAFVFSLTMTLPTAWAVDLDPASHQAVPGDFNGDGRVDALLQPLLTGGQGAILLQDGTGNLSVLAQGWDPGYLGLDWSADKSLITTADLNGDSRDDVIVQSRAAGQSASVLITDPTSQLLKVEQVIPAGYLGLDWSTGGHLIVPGDFDGDRQKELLLQAVKPGDGGAIVHADQAGHLMAVTQLIPASYLGRRWDAEDVTLYVGDFNGDGRQDLLMQVNAGAEKAGEPTYALLLADPNGQFTQIAELWNNGDFGADWSPATHTLSVQDLTGSGRMAIVLTSKDPNGTSYVFEPNGQGLVDKATAQWTGPGTARNAVAKQQTGSKGISVVAASTSTASPSSPTQTQSVMHAALAQSVTVTIGNAPQTPTTIGPMGGQSGVEGGSATYSIPIVVPAGIAGMQPSLSLNYSSHGGNGEMGMGWSLSGTSAIHRCPATYAQDGHTEGVTYADGTDRLCLDGQHLVYVGSGAYRTERDSGVRVTQFGGALSSGSTYFEVDYQDGHKSYYGLPNSNSQFVAQWPSNAVAPFPTLVWAIARTDDLAGNNITYSYRNFGNGEYHLTAINYTGKTTGSGANASVSTGTREVDFSYTTRTDTSSTYLAGGRTDETQLLALITTKVGTAEANHYNLGYAPSGATGRSLLRTAQECGYAWGSSTVACLPPESFTWEELPLSYNSPAPVSVPAGVPALATYTQDAGQDANFSASGDFDGDGRDDYYYALGHGYLYPLDMSWTLDLSTIFPSGDRPLDMHEDFMRTGVAEPLGMTTAVNYISDLVVAVCTANTAINPTACESQTNYATYDTGVSAWNGTWVTGDFTGDGKPDVLAKDASNPNAPAVYLYPNNTPSGASYPTFDAPINLAPLQLLSGSCLYPQYQQFSEIGDMDGDGIPDLLITGIDCGFNTNSPAAIAFIKSFPGQGDQATSANTTATVKTMAQLGITVDFTHLVYFFADINGDGLKDFVYVAVADNGANMLTWHYQLNQGGDFGFAPEHDTGVNANYDNSATHFITPYTTVKVGDFTGEGKDELLVPTSLQSTYCETVRKMVNGAWESDIVCTHTPQDHNVYGFNILKFVQQADGTYLPGWVTNGSGPVAVDGEAGTTSVGDIYGIGITDLYVLYSPWFQNAWFNDPTDAYCPNGAGNAPCVDPPADGYYTVTPVGDAQHPHGEAPDLMTGATDSLGAQAAWNYDSLADLVGSGGYSVHSRPCNTATNINPSNASEYYCFASSMWVVQSYTVSNGVGGSNQYTYQYSDAIYEDEGRGFQGFQSITVNDLTAGTYTVNSYRQDFPMSGMLTESTTYQQAGNIMLSDTKNTWFPPANPTGCLPSAQVFWAQLQKSVVTKNNADGNQISQTTALYTYDADGNTHTVNATTTDAAGTYSSSTTDNFFPSDCTNWWTDKLQQKIVSTTVSYNLGFLTATPPATSTVVHSMDYTYNASRKILTEDADLGTTLTANGEPNTTSYEKLATYGYDGFGNLTSTTVTTGVPQPSGALSNTQDYGFAGSRQTSTGYNAAGYFPITLTDALGHVTNITGTDPLRGKPISVTAPDGVVTTSSYDAFGRPLSEQAGDTNAVSISYGTPSALCGTAVYMSSAVQTGAAGKYACYDMLNRAVLSYVDGFSAGVQFQSQTIYNNLGQVQQASEPFSQQEAAYYTSYTYDVLNRVKTKLTPTGVTASYSYGVGPTGPDPLATQIVVSTTDGSPTTTSYEIHDSPGKLLSTTDTKGSETDFYYDAGGNPVLIRDAAGNQTLASYNLLGQKISVSDPDQGSSTFVYDVLGELLQQTDAKNQKITQAYDNGGRMVSRSFPALFAGSSIIATDIWCYDGATLTPGTPPSPGTCGAPQSVAGMGKLSAVGQYDGYHESYSYDQDGRLASTLEHINGNDYQTATSYDADGRVSTVSYPATIADTALNPSITPSATTVQTGTAVTLTGAASNGNSSSTMAQAYQWSVVSATCNCTPSLTSTTTKVTQFTPSAPGTYTFQFSVNDGLQTASAQVTITAQPAPPGTLNINSNTGVVGNYSVSWGTSSNGTSYNLYQSTNGGSSWTQVACQPNCAWLTASFTGMGSRTQNITYTYKATASANGIEGPASNSASFTVVWPPTAPTPNTLPSQSNPDGSFTVSWGASTGVSPVYLAESGIPQGDSPTLWTGNTCTSSGASCTITGDTNGTTYVVRVSSCNGTACNTPVLAPGSVKIVIPPPPPAPSISETDDGDGVDYTISFSAPTATSYQLYFAHATQLAGPWSAWAQVSGVSSSPYDTSSPKAQYYLRYYAVGCNTSGCGAASSVVTFTNPLENAGCTTCLKVNPPGPTTNSAPVSATPTSTAQPVAPATGPTAMLKAPSLDTLLAVQPMAALAAPMKPKRKTARPFEFAPPVYEAYADARIMPASGSNPIVGLTVTYQYNASGYLSQIVDAVNPSHVYWKATGVNARQLVTDEAYGINGSSTAVTSHRDYYPASGFAKNIQSGTGSSTGAGTGSSLQNLHYDWWELGNLQDRQDSRQGLSEAFQYDTLNRLTSAAVTNGSGAQTPMTLTYDALGNIKCKSDVVGSACPSGSGAYSYGGSAGPHAVTVVTGLLSNGNPFTRNYSYDADGNMTSRNGLAIAWNADNMATCLDLTGGTCTSSTGGVSWSAFNYAPDKHRYSQTAEIGGVPETTVYAGALEIVTDASGTHNRYQLTAYGRSIAIVDLETNAGGAVVNTQYLLTDNLGSVDGATDANGAFIAGTGWSFDAFGQRRNPATWVTPDVSSQTTADRSNGTSNGVSSGVTHRGYTGHEELDALGLIHMNGRVYNPGLGRFLSVDPVFQFPTNTQSLNPYSYVLNNPLSMTDPTGYTSYQGICIENMGCAGGEGNRDENGHLIKSNADSQSNGTDSSQKTAGAQQTDPTKAGGGDNTPGQTGKQSDDDGDKSSSNLLGQIKSLANSLLGEGTVANLASVLTGDAIKNSTVSGTVEGVKTELKNMLNDTASGAINSGGFMHVHVDDEPIKPEGRLGAAGADAIILAAGGIGKGAIEGVSAEGAAGRAALDDVKATRLGGAASNSAVGIGSFAGDSIPARSTAKEFTSVERAEINRIGSESGCHTCGTIIPGTKSGNFVPDHQPPSALNQGGAPQRLFPQCLTCSRQQGLEIARMLQNGGPQW